MNKMPIVGERPLELRASLVELYKQFNPTKINSIDHIMTEYTRTEDAMFRSLYVKLS